METDDPIIQYIVVRESLGMSPGKLGAQIGHAIMLFMEGLAAVQATVPASDHNSGVLGLATEWRRTDYTKIVKRADDKEFERVRLEHQPNFVVVDLGRTEIAAGSETVMAFWPMRRSAQSKTLKRLRLL